MSSLDDLRTTLEQHAEGFEDPNRYVRPVAVRERVRVTRRRRATVAMATAAALVVAAVAGVGALRQPDDLEPASSVAGVDVPRQVSITGFPYELIQTVPFADRTRLALDPSDADRAVSLAARDLGDGSATLYADDQPIARARGGHDLEAPVPTGATELKVRLHGAPADARVGIAVYGATGGLADGVTDADRTAVFRSTIGSDRLLVGAFSDPGRSEVSVEFTGALSDVRFSDYCTTDEKGLWLNVEIDDQGPISGPCGPGTTNDPGTSSSSFEGHRVRDRVVRAYLTRGANGPEVSSASAVLGVAVYEQPGVESRYLGMRIASTVEYAGRVWTVDRVVPQSSGSGAAVQVPIDTSDGDRLIGFIASGRRVSLTWSGRLQQGGSSSINATGSAGSELAGVLLSGDSFDVRLASAAGDDFSGEVLVYRPL